jgi:triosephosphate isomerase
MFKTVSETRAFFSAFKPLVASTTHCDIVVAPTFTSLAAAAEAASGSNIAISAQNMYFEKQGAFTGEVSAAMIVEAGCRYVILGHSERRHIFGETDAIVAKKTVAALDAGLTPIVCVGETLDERNGNQTETVLARQCVGGIGALTDEQFSRILLAYEPVWAIGTGRTATPEMAGDAHLFLRNHVASRFTSDLAENLRILYGGSVKPDNIRGLMAQLEIDGALVGGASLEAASFASIVNF